jgi:hypothetical protein
MNDYQYRHLFQFHEYTEKKQFQYVPLTFQGNWSLYGHFQSVKYFAEEEALIRYYFEPKSSIKSRLMEKYEDVLCKNTCAIHVRRIGERDFPTRDTLWVPLLYYWEAMKFIPDATFLIFSNDLSWCEQHFKGKSFIFVRDQADIEDMFLMSLCKHNIISNSTFSWWSAWLNMNPHKVVVAPNPWLGWSRGDLNMGSLVLPGWHKINIENMAFTPLQKSLNKIIRSLPFAPRFTRYVLRRLA